MDEESKTENLGFRVGRRQVPELSGSWNIPPILFILLFVLPGLTAVIYSLYSFARWLLTGIALGPEAPFMLIWGLGFGGFGIALWLVRKKLLKLSPLADLGAQIDMDGRSLQQTLEDRGIQPHFVVNGQPYYDPRELGGRANLLRAANESEMTLLHPTSPPNPESQYLVRPAGQTQENSSSAVNEGNEARVQDVA